MSKEPKPNSDNPASAAPGLDPLVIRHILVPVDFSEPSLKMLRRAAAFAAHFNARLTLIHVVESYLAFGMEAVPLARGTEQVAKMARRKLKVLARPPRGAPPLAVDTLVRRGKPFHEICEAARELAVDLVIIATQGHTGLEHLLLGSTAERVVRYAPCPVLVCRTVACQATP